MKRHTLALFGVLLLGCTSCTASQAQQAAVIVGGALPAACPLVEVLTADAFAGVVCQDVAQIVSTAISALKADSSASAPCELAPLYDGTRYVGETCLGYHDAADQALKARAAAHAARRKR